MRIKGGLMTKKRHKKIIKMAKGYSNKRHNVYSFAKKAVQVAGRNAYIGRKLKKRDFRSLWIVRLNAALKQHNIAYSRFIYKLTRKRVLLNRKMLSELAIKEPKIFEEVVKFVMA